jgi:glutathionylspermidine synthase
MRRVACEPRPDWQRKVEAFGLFFHTTGGVPYWDESACYQLRRAEVDALEEATDTLHRLCLDLVGEVIADQRLGLFLIPPEFEGLVVKSWEEREPSVYGRFDLAFNGAGPPKLLEYNADTPTALVEAAVAQWFWLKDRDEFGDQFNGIHERLIEAWRALRARDGRPVHFAALSGVVEDYVTVEYLRDTAIQAGFETDYLDVEQIGWHADTGRFVGRAGEPIERLFKLYPWEWLLKDQFGPHVLAAATRFVEPPWKMILSCKAILPLLWERHPDCPYLLPASFEPLPGSFVRKPLHAREGSNITVVVDGAVKLETGGPYGEGPFVYQALAPLSPFDGRYPVLGSWVVNGAACGVGIREDDAMITQNTSRFVPHQMVD